MFSGQLTTSLGIEKTPKGQALAALIVQLISLPGYIFTIFFIEEIGVIRLQLLGFLLSGGICIILGAAQQELVNVSC